tara:strand:- start:1178 stop:1420 length:243 start_codon:yes stop_codon:yes gene_type:complete
MTDAQIITNINAFSDDQKGYFNSDCESKIHTIRTSPSLSQVDIDLAKDTAAAVNALSDSEIAGNIDVNLSKRNKLSIRPC